MTMPSLEQDLPKPAAGAGSRSLIPTGKHSAPLICSPGAHTCWRHQRQALGALESSAAVEPNEPEPVRGLAWSLQMWGRLEDADSELGGPAC